jgi:6-phosphofructokinase 2
LVETPLPRIVTLTLSPAVDVATSVARLVPFTKMRCAPAQRDPGGGGINVARVLKRLGMDVTAIYPAGGATGQVLETLVAAEGVHSIAIATSRDTREDLTIFDETTREQFRLVFPGPPLDDSEWQACLEAIATIAPGSAFVVASGSVPAGVPPDFFDRLARACPADSKLVVDTSGPFQRAALDAGVYLIKPNLREFRELTGLTATDDTALIDAGRHLFDRARVEVIAISMGPQGALLMTRDRAWRAQGLPVEAISVSGAGDSFLGAMVWSLAHDGNLDTALRYGVAGGSAALLNPGTDLCRAGDVHRLASEVIVTPLARDHDQPGGSLQG